MRTWILPLTLGLALPLTASVAVSVGLAGCNGSDDDTVGEANCVDGVDDDNDGLTDCDDPDCAATLACSDTGDTDDTDDTDDTGETGEDVYRLDTEATAIYYGEDDNDWAGYAVAGGVDINGDGNEDLIIGAPNHDCDDATGAAMENSGAAYVIFGPPSGQHDLGDADIKICGERPNAGMGSWVGLSQDLTADGAPEVIVSSPGENGGRVYVLSGLAAPGDGEPVYPSADGVISSDIIGEGAEAHFGYVFTVGALGRSGSNPVLAIGSDAWSTDTASNLGRAYLFRPDLDANERARNAETSFSGTQAGETAARDLAIADFDGDGNGDIAIGALKTTEGALDEAGRVYVKYGGSGTDSFIGARWELTSADATLTGRSSNEGVGQLVDDAGDFNNDGYTDLLVGAHTAGNNTGAAYLWFGSSERWGSINSAEVDAVFEGSSAFDSAGHGGAGVGDMTADGIDDIMIGAIGVSSEGLNGSGAVYLVAGGTTGVYELDDIAVRKWGGTARQEQAGHRVSALGDINGDERADAIVGAFWNPTNGSRAGAAYILTGPITE